MNGRPISNRYRAFAPEYVSNGFNGAKAVIDLGFTQNRRSATVIATRLLANVSCRALINQYIMKAKISADEVLEELSSIARQPINNYSESAKLKALELSGKAHKLFVDRVESTVTETNTPKDLLLRRIDRISAKTGRNPREIALELQSGLSDKTDEDYSPELDQAISEVVSSFPATDNPIEIGDQ